MGNLENKAQSCFFMNLSFILIPEKLIVLVWCHRLYLPAANICHIWWSAIWIFLLPIGTAIILLRKFPTDYSFHKKVVPTFSHCSLPLHKLRVADSSSAHSWHSRVPKFNQTSFPEMVEVRLIMAWGQTRGQTLPVAWPWLQFCLLFPQRTPDSHPFS